MPSVLLWHRYLQLQNNLATVCVLSTHCEHDCVKYVSNYQAENLILIYISVIFEFRYDNYVTISAFILQFAKQRPINIGKNNFLVI